MEKLKLRAMIQDLAEDIAGSMLQELKVISTEPTPGSAIAVEKLADQVAKEVAEEMAEHLLAKSAVTPTVGQEERDKLAALEQQVEELAQKLRGPSPEEGTANLPNLKYAKSKYHNVESLLNYIENKDSEGGIKLVIMNFND